MINLENFINYDPQFHSFPLYSVVPIQLNPYLSLSLIQSNRWPFDPFNTSVLINANDVFSQDEYLLIFLNQDNVFTINPSEKKNYYIYLAGAHPTPPQSFIRIGLFAPLDVFSTTNGIKHIKSFSTTFSNFMSTNPAIFAEINFDTENPNNSKISFMFKRDTQDIHTFHSFPFDLLNFYFFSVRVIKRTWNNIPILHLYMHIFNENLELVKKENGFILADFPNSSYPNALPPVSPFFSFKNFYVKTFYFTI